MQRAMLFDSGVGGLSILSALENAGLALAVDYVADTAWLPYGEKPDDLLKARIPRVIVAAAKKVQPNVIVIACNTASTLALEEIRQSVAVPVVGVVPAIKPAAAATRSHVIGLLATPATVRRAYTDALIEAHAAGVTVIRAGSADLVLAAEEALAGHVPAKSRITAALEALFNQPRGDEIDTIVLACTHFPLLAKELVEAAPARVQFMDSGEAVARRTAQLLALTTGQGMVQRQTAMATSENGLLALRAAGFASVTLLPLDA